ncbi:hypothetical protein SteCoe_19724 [Stentor coeruleus]|uniref:C2H2-type domain-containing protein n=1 Tax=Stentor coeruleus TaxID=5963 RepID=A0A1R2BTD1_9CILI|nr:hypothetical protein SteCoe_19724 [Stentor coeruleus]
MKVIEEFKVYRYCCMHFDCGKYYSSKMNLKRHCLVRHTNFSKFQCSICKKCLASKQNLEEHSYIHTGERPYKCEVCWETFRHLSSLSVHAKIHNQDPRLF